MADRYENFAHLARHEREGRDYRIHAVARASPVLVLAPHGGFMEPGTHLIAAFIAGERHACYAFETLARRDRAKSMHITSARFDEPRALALLATAEIAIGVHGRFYTAGSLTGSNESALAVAGFLIGRVRAGS